MKEGNNSKTQLNFRRNLTSKNILRKRPKELNLKNSNFPVINKNKTKNYNSQLDIKSFGKTVNKFQTITAEHLKTKNAYKLYFLFKEKIPPSPSDYHWILNLRNTPVCKNGIKNKVKEKENIDANIHEPSFYNEDLTKFRKRFLTNSKSDYDIHLKDFSKYEFLYKRKQFSNPLTVSLINTLLGYRSSFRLPKRLMKIDKNGNIVKISQKDEKNEKEKKWHISREKILCSNTTYFPKNGGIGYLNEKFVNRPYKKTFKDINYEGKKLRTIVFTRDEEKAYDHLGNFQNNSIFEEVLKGENYAPLEHYLTGKNKSLTDCWYKLSLRKILDKKNKVKSNKINDKK